MPWSEGQFKALAIVPKVTSILSFLGSMYILYDVLTSPKKRQRVYHHILLSMSACDLIIDVGLFLSTWPIPKDTPLIYGASGTQQTCTAQGFVLQLFGIMAPLYNVALSIYYLLMIKHSWSEERLRALKVPIHVLIWIPALGTSIAGLPLTLYNNAILYCWIASLPIGCQESSKNDGNSTCIRGDNANSIYRWAFYYGLAWAAIAFATYAMCQVSWAVYTQERKSRRWGALRVRRHSRNVVVQAIYYVGVMFLTLIWTTIIRIMQTANGKVEYSLLLLAAIFLPLQGFFNCIVYVRPQFQAYREDHSFWESVREVFLARLLPAKSSTTQDTTTRPEEMDYNVAKTNAELEAERATSNPSRMKNDAMAETDHELETERAPNISSRDDNDGAAVIGSRT